MTATLVAGGYIMFKNFFVREVYFDVDRKSLPLESLGDYIDEQVEKFLKNNPDLVEVNRSSPSITALPRGDFGNGAMIFMAVTCEFASANK